MAKGKENPIIAAIDADYCGGGNNPGRLRQLRKELGMSRDEMAELFHVERSIWVRWESGKTVGSYTYFVMLDIAVNYFRQNRILLNPPDHFLESVVSAMVSKKYEHRDFDHQIYGHYGKKAEDSTQCIYPYGQRELAELLSNAFGVNFEQNEIGKIIRGHLRPNYLRVACQAYAIAKARRLAFELLEPSIELQGFLAEKIGEKLNQTGRGLPKRAIRSKFF